MKTETEQLGPRAALVTGASSGIGLELAKLLASDGYDLALVARPTPKLDKACQKIRDAYGVQVAGYGIDLAQPEGPATLLRRLKQDGIEVRVLINNAGFGHWGSFVQMDESQVLQMIQLNVTTLTQLTRRLLPAMIKRDAGKILNVASTAAFQPGPLMAVYYATKAYVLLLSEALAEELQHTGVTVTALCPGPTETGFQQRAQLEGSRLMTLMRTMDAAAVAREGYQGMLKGESVVIPGLANRLLVESIRFTPRSIVPKIVKIIQGER